MGRVQAAERFNAAAQASPRPSFLAEIDGAGARHGASPVCVHRTPLLLTQSEVRAVRRSLPPMHRLLRKARAALLSDLHRGADSLAASLGTPLDAIEWAQLDPGFASVAPLARLDAYVVDGVPKFLELNAESPAGMGYASAIARVVSADPAWAAAGLSGEFHDPVPHAVRTVRAVAKEYGVHPRFSLAIVDFRGVATAPEFALLAAAFRQAGHHCQVVDPRELCFDGSRLSGPEGTIDVVFRRLVIRDLRANLAECEPLLRAYRQHKVCMVNSLRTALLHNKAVFALLHDDNFPLSAAERRFVSRHIPETRLLEAGVRDRVASDRQNWVCKPVDSHGGQGVVLGWTATEAEWHAALSRPGAHIVQRRVSAPVGDFFDARDGQLHRRIVDLGPFLALGKFAGFLCRLAEGELANVSAGGASQVPVFSCRQAERPAAE